MNKIKIVGIFIFLISFSLTIVTLHINNQNSIEAEAIDAINKHKAFTQEISKTIFYIYKNKKIDNKLEDSIKLFLANTTNDSIDSISFYETTVQKDKIQESWNKFYLMVENFRKINRVKNAYTNIILEKTVNDIYNLNLSLIFEFDKLIKIQQLSFKNQLNNIRNLQYILFFTLLTLLLYLFTQLKTLISFIQKFLHTSKNIIEKSTIKGLKQIDISSNNAETSLASNNFNVIVEKIDNSLQNATASAEQTHKLLEEVEINIESMLELFFEMTESETRDKELTKKEDAVIESLEQLITTRTLLQNLKNDLDNLITHSKLKN